MGRSVTLKSETSGDEKKISTKLRPPDSTAFWSRGELLLKLSTTELLHGLEFRTSPDIAPETFMRRPSGGRTTRPWPKVLPKISLSPLCNLCSAFPHLAVFLGAPHPQLEKRIISQTCFREQFDFSTPKNRPKKNQFTQAKRNQSWAPLLRSRARNIE